MTPRQKQALDYITAYIGQHGYSPSYDEMCGHFGLKSKSGVHAILRGLEQQGHIYVVYGRARGVALRAADCNDPYVHWYTNLTFKQRKAVHDLSKQHSQIMAGAPGVTA